MKGKLTINDINKIPKSFDVIGDILIDYYRNVAWIRMYNKGIIKVDL